MSKQNPLVWVAFAATIWIGYLTIQSINAYQTQLDRCFVREYEAAPGKAKTDISAYCEAYARSHK
jgi:hypothetical protein